MNFLGADLGATFGDVAEADAEVVLQQADAMEGVKWVKFEPGHAYEKSRAAEFRFCVMLANDVANILAKKTFDALAEFLDAVDIELGDFPVGVLVRAEGGDFFVDLVIPGNVGDQVFDSRKRFHGHDGDGLVLGKIVHARFAGEARAAVDFGGARAALPCFAVPADGQVGGQVALNVMQRVEYDHARGDGHGVVDGLAAYGAFAAEYS
jgi:hypothetical protein